MPKIVDKRNKRNDILQAAIRVFVRNGIMHTRISDVAGEAGIGKGTVYEYFASKEDILSTAVEQIVSRMYSIMEKAIRESTDPVEQLTTFLNRTMIFFIKSTIPYGSFMIEVWAERFRSDDSAFLNSNEIQSAHHGYREIIEGVIRDGMEKGIFRHVDTRLVAMHILALIDGLLAQWYYDPEHFDVEVVMNSLYDWLFKGIMKIDIEAQ